MTCSIRQAVTGRQYRFGCAARRVWFRDGNTKGISSITQGTTRMESCLAMMWHEVDTPSGEQGHYVAMSSTTHTRVACGISTSATNVWALQNFSR